jgi:glycosyltransferase involved in cell wall biosynthesis
MQHHVLFLTLKVFSATGGIEKVSRLAGKALVELCREEGVPFHLYAMYDNPAPPEEKYFPTPVFRGFSGNRVRFVLQSILRGKGASLVIMSHINLLSIGYLIKKLSPRTRVVLLAHGIEVWETLPAWKKVALRSCDLVLPVSRFTRERMLDLHNLPEEKLVVVNNCLDPFLPPAEPEERSAPLLAKYGMQPGDKVILTVNRLSFKERYKGYDEVLMAIKALKRRLPHIRYLVVGQYDPLEKARLDRLIRQQGLEAEVVFAGFVPDEELAAHFGLADVYAMPSRKEGFGIVFIEAMFYGLPVIAGNIDGSADALADGELGFLVDPDQPEEILSALECALNRRKEQSAIAEAAVQRFGFETYKQKLAAALHFSQRGNPTAINEQPKDRLALQIVQ